MRVVRRKKKMDLKGLKEVEWEREEVNVVKRERQGNRDWNLENLMIMMGKEREKRD